MDCELIDEAPRIGLYKVERTEIEPWDFELPNGSPVPSRVR